MGRVKALKVEELYGRSSMEVQDGAIQQFPLDCEYLSL
jgi:hypothetical protein